MPGKTKNWGEQLGDGTSKEKNEYLKNLYMIEDMPSSKDKEETSSTAREENQLVDSLFPPGEMTSIETAKSLRPSHHSSLDAMAFSTAADDLSTVHLSSPIDIESTIDAEETQRKDRRRASSPEVLVDYSTETEKPNKLEESTETITPKTSNKPINLRLMLNNKRENKSDDSVGNEPFIQKNGVAAITPAEKGSSERTIDEQCLTEPNFIGDAYYYNLLRGSNRRELAGEYVIVCTRPLGTRFGRENGQRSRSFPPLYSRRFKITTVAPRSEDSVEDRFLRRRLEFGGSGSDFGVGECTIETIGSFMFFCDPVNDDARNMHSHKTTFRVQQPRLFEASVFEDSFIHDENCLFLKGFLKNASLTGSTIAFGLRHIRTEDGVKYGFNFVEIELAFCDPETALPDRQIFVAVKIPQTDISSTKLLTQRITSSHDLKIIEDGGSEAAGYFYYCDSYMGSGQGFNWGPENEKDIGILNNLRQFNSALFERYLFLQDDRLEQLRFLVDWLDALLASSMEIEGSQVNELQKAARKYATCRLAGMEKEAFVCEADDEQDVEEALAMEEALATEEALAIAEALAMEKEEGKIENGIMTVDDLIEYDNSCNDLSSELSDIDMEDVGGAKL